ncbi:MAG: BamA/TamA family outer membrane protein [Saprospiraceae bacterium]
MLKSVVLAFDKLFNACFSCCVSAKLLVTCCLCFLFLQNGFAQTTHQIDSVYFEGVKRTKLSFLKGFLNDLVGKTPSEEELKAEVQKLKNIPGIGNAAYRIEKTDKATHIVFIVEEQQTLLPIVNFGGIKDNIFFRLGAYDINWRGRGELLSLNYQNTDQRHGGQLYYRVPFFRSSQWGFSASLARLASREPLYFNEGEVTYLYDNNSAAFTIIRNFGINRNIEIGATYFQEKYKKTEDQQLDNPPGPDNFKQPKWLMKWSYRTNFINYDYIYRTGYSWQLLFQNVYNTVYGDWFNSLQLQGRRYYKFGNWGNLAMRLHFAIATNNDSPFAPFVVDSHVNLRGSGNRIDRGTAQAVYNLEYRQTVFTTGNKHWAGQVVAFSDLGAWRNPGGNLEDLVDPELLRHYLGGGVRIIYQKVYSAVLRIDYGVDVFHQRSRGWVIGLGQYF